MAKAKKSVVQPEVVQSQDTPVTTDTPVQPVTKTAKKVRYAPRNVLSNPEATITVLVSGNPKRQGSMSFTRWEQIPYSGQTVASFQAAFKAANLSGMLARNDLRWAVEHGFIAIESTEAAE